MFFSNVMDFANKFFFAVASVSEWFFTPLDISVIITRFVSGNILLSTIVDKLDLFTGIEIAPADMFLVVGTGTLLGLIIIKFFLDMVL